VITAFDGACLPCPLSKAFAAISATVGIDLLSA